MDEAEAISFSLDELSDESGLDTRVIRSFIEQGLLRGPSKLGRYARYSQQHLHKLLAIKVLKDKQGLKLSEVRQQLLSMSEAQIEMLATTGSISLQRPTESALDYILRQTNRPPTSATEITPPGSKPFEDDDFDDEEEDYDENESAPPVVKGKPVHGKASQAGQVLDGWGPGPEFYQRITKERMANPIGKLLVGLEEQTGDKHVRRQAKKETWHRIQVTPDIELSVRGINDEEQLARLERVADYLREILTGEA
jgi:DNA-binding transcriptional MerR regulator